MPTYRQIAFTVLELKGLWIRATGGSTADDPELDKAAEQAIEKVWRSEKGMSMPGHPPGHHRGPDLELRTCTALHPERFYRCRLPMGHLGTHRTWKQGQDANNDLVWKAPQ